MQRVEDRLAEDGTAIGGYGVGLFCRWDSGEVDLYLSDRNFVCVKWERRDAFGLTGDDDVTFILDRDTAETEIVNALAATVGQYRDGLVPTSPYRWGEISPTFATDVADALLRDGHSRVRVTGDAAVLVSEDGATSARAVIIFDEDSADDRIVLVATADDEPDSPDLDRQMFRSPSAELVSSAMGALLERSETGQETEGPLRWGQPVSSGLTEVADALATAGAKVLSVQSGNVSARTQSISIDGECEDQVVFLDEHAHVLVLRRCRAYLYPTREEWSLEAWAARSTPEGPYEARRVLPFQARNGKPAHWADGQPLTDDEIVQAWVETYVMGGADEDPPSLGDFLAGHHAERQFHPDDEPGCIPVLSPEEIARQCLSASARSGMFIATWQHEWQPRPIPFHYEDFLRDLADEVLAPVSEPGRDERTTPTPELRLIKSARDAELVAAEWMRWMGFEAVAATPIGPDGGIDVDSLTAVAQVKAETLPVGRPALQQIAGAAAPLRKAPLFFSLSGYTGRALAWAETVGLPLFEFDLQGVPKPVNDPARRLLPVPQSPHAAAVGVD